MDLAQDLLPNSERDNDGETLGLFFYDVLLRPTVDWLPFEAFAVAHYGDLDWEQGMQTMDTDLIGPIAGWIGPSNTARTACLTASSGSARAPRSLTGGRSSVARSETYSEMSS